MEDKMWWLSVLGFAGKIKDFFFKNWKIVLPILLIIGAYWYHTNAVEDAFDAGVVAEQEANAERVRIENELNREFEDRLDVAIENYGERIAERTAERTAAEMGSRETIRTIIQDNPIYEQCLVDPEVIDEQNNIRALGPGGR